MNKKLIGLMIVAAMGLTACGSSGGARNGMAESMSLGSGTSSSSNSSSSNSSSSSTNTTDTTTTTTTSSGWNVSYEIDAAAGTHDVNKDTDANYQIASPADVNVLEIDNRKITLVPTGATVDSDKYFTQTGAPFNGAGANSWRMVNTSIDGVRFGEMYIEGENRHWFAQGQNQTAEANMPTTGTAKYSGEATYSLPAEGMAAMPKKGNVNFDVNFGERTIYGQVTPKVAGEFHDAKLEGTITGSSFTGQNHEHLTTVNGHFYGNNGENIAGVYGRNTASSSTYGLSDIQTENLKKNVPTLPESEINMHGTFGATKQ